MRVHHQPSYVLLNRAYSESSWIVEIFSRDYGRLALMAKGARRIKSQLKGVLLPFQPVLLSWTGKGEIPTLTSAEIEVSKLNMMEFELRGDQLVCGFYCNELLSYLLHRYDAHPRLFDRYHETIMRLYDPQSVAGEARLAATLREFEQMMVKETGYAVDFEFEADGKTAIDSQSHYYFQPGEGFKKRSSDQANSVRGDVILGMQSTVQKADNEYDMASSKRLMRDILKQNLGNKKINSRDLFYPKDR